MQHHRFSSLTTVYDVLNVVFLNELKDPSCLCNLPQRAILHQVGLTRRNLRARLELNRSRKDTASVPLLQVFISSFSQIAFAKNTC